MQNRINKLALWVFTPLIGLSMMLGTELNAATVTLSSGRQVDLTPKQVDQLKMEPGVYYLDYPTEKFIHSELDQWEVIELPPELGGGFLLAPVQSMERALESVKAGPPVQTVPAPSKVKPADTALQIKRSRFDARFKVQTGLRQDDVDWNIAGNSSGADPNVRTEVIWDDVSIWQLGAEFQSDIKRHYHVRAALAYGRVFDGTSRQSDYLADDRTNEFSRVLADSSSGSTLDASIGLGYQFRFSADRFGLIPLLGLAYNRQNLEMTDGNQVVSDFGFPAAEGPIPGLDNTYEATWKGPWIGLDFIFRSELPGRGTSELTTTIGATYHWVDYSADGSWNLNTDLGQPDQFEHEADGTGFNVNASVEWMFKPHWGFNAGFVYRNWSAEGGTEKAGFVDGSSTTRRLNDVNWTSYGIDIGITYRF